MSSDPRAVGEDLVEHASWFGEAPCLAIVIHKRPPAAGAGFLEGLPDPALVSGEPLSAAMAVENALLAAHAMGLGSCVLTAPLLVPEALEGIGDLPAGFVPTCLIALGYPAEDPPPPRRKEIRHLVEFRGEP